MASRIWEAFHQVVAAGPDRIAIYGLSESGPATFAQLSSDAHALRIELAQRLPAAPCLIAAVGNRTAFVPLLLAASALGAATVLLDGGSLFADVAAVADRLAADGIVLRVEMALAQGLPFEPLAAGLCLVRRVPTEAAQWRHDGREPCILKMTSGSGGRPRAVVATESHLVEDARQIAEAMTITSADVNLAVIPLAHSYAIGNLLMPLLLQGSPMALRDRFAPREVADDVRACGVTTFPGVPYIYEHLRRHGLAEALRGLRLMITAGAPVSHETVLFYQQATGRKIHSFYGTSETGGISYDDTDEVGGYQTVGRPMPRTIVTLLPCASASPGAGRVFVQGAAVAPGYAITEADDGPAAFVDGGFLTGDLGSSDDSGRLVLIGRVSNFINVAGRKVDPAEVEAVLRSATSVLEARVIGLPCGTRGEQVVACIRPRDTGGVAAQLRAHCARHLAAHKVPRQILVFEELPVDRRGKLDRVAIERLLGRSTPTPYNALAVEARTEDE